MNRVTAWAWAIQGAKGQWVLCRWAVANKDELVSDGIPSPEARAVRVYIQDVPKTKNRRQVKT